jgi:hypothetical protein
MRNAATTTGNISYSALVEGCQHSRLKAALSGGLAPAPRAPLAAPAPRACAPSIGEATRAYFWVAGMSVASLLGIVVSGTITA